ncbi:MYCBP-associated protein-like isoform X3 [Haliotis rufescens]|uniref:MYCBP-associated protein-like isoform X3 n=1 Tax=Haliotis rufescens TaxID=6454 RepID=UPI00201E7DF4|nr:MYCBP-associated protein-like isoform X3 [Haliotis rufescens]
MASNSKRSMSVQFSQSAVSTLLVKHSTVTPGGLRRHSLMPASDKLHKHGMSHLAVPGQLGRRGSLFTHRLSKRDGKRRDTPEKSATPSQEENSENRPPSRNVIWNEEIEKLQIKDDDLQKIHEPRPPAERKKTPVPSTVTVRKLKPPAELEKPRPKIVTVAKPAPPDAPVKPIDYSGFAGPRYNPDGSVIQHSILGSYNDFHRQAVKKGDLIDIPSPRELDTQPPAPTLKYEKKRKMMKDNIRAQADENNALKNWQLRMIERKRQQGYISKLLQKSPEDLAMNQADNFRSIQEQRHIIDRTIPTMDYGKGYRVGSEYWKQQERFGDETVGIHMTLTQTEKGYPVPVEHVGLPQTVRKEKGCPWSPNYTVPVFYPWHKAPFYEKRKRQLQSVIDELDPHQPDFDQLEVIGTNDPFRGRAEIESDSGLTERLESEDRYLGLGEGDKGPQDPLQDHPDVYPEPVFGPSLQIAGQPARWTGDSHGFIGQPGIQARISFESYTSERITSYLEIINDGTTSIYYDWKQLPKDNPFELVQATVQRFYFNNSSGVILPGETMKFPFVFKSPNAGVFTEQWKFETRPVVCGGADLIVSLRGVALQEDIYQKQRQELEKDLQTKQANQVVTQILDELIDAIRMPDRPQSPVDAYITEEEIFRRHNQGMHYSHETVVELKQIYLQLFPEEERVGKFWDLCVQDLKDLVMDLDEDDENKEPFLHRINEAVGKMSYTPNHPIQQQLYKIGYEYLIEAVDGIVGQSMFVRHILGMPEKEIEEFPESDLIVPQPDPAKLAVPRKGPVRTSSIGEEGDSRRGKTADKSKADGKDKKGAPGKDPKAAKSGKEGENENLSTPKLDPKKAPPGPKKPPSRGPVATPGPVERAATPVSTPSSPTPYADPVLERKYREKLYCQAYTVIGEAIDRMDQAFADMLKNNTLDRLRPV